MIQTFSDKVTAALFTGRCVRRLPKSIQRTALRKLLMIDAATCVEDLLVPPGNRLEGLHGKPVDLWSIRVNRMRSGNDVSQSVNGDAESKVKQEA
ncbi:type II toxin-antitoxin system RelE/ParE family toxin [Pandoraea iniqua]|nr:type II toxin-antitoxin system RelE/ParE family toxin [Pandoraea iniqua]